ncbi:ATP-grasp ribosomal peptide maturase [Pseudonocardia sp. NPDC046786]|uniref:ATP-grasp ribosomal peptide maturase n=1 Tax=Pseudonocardia sp. NPDC046786 TaxID=3155471 RepID=UPI0033F6C070
MPVAAPVLVLTDPYDITADHVVDELNRRGHPVFRCDPGEFPARLSVTARFDRGWAGRLRLPGTSVALDEIGCACYRRPSTFELSGDLGEHERRWARREARRGLGGLLAALPRWLNHPFAIAAAEYKPVQLELAARAGLVVPTPIITNDAADARAFVSSVESAIYKPLAGGVLGEAGEHKLTYTNRVTVDEIDDSVAATAHLFQSWVQKQHEIRLTVVDATMFAIRIDAESAAAHQDWRSDYPSLRYRVVEIPHGVRTSVATLMDALRLRFAAIDFVVDHDGQWTFLEVNPNGQWAWLENATGAPIASAIAETPTGEQR